MNTEMTPASAAADSNSTPAALLNRILIAVEGDKKRGRLELLVAIVLSLASLASTWCGYQASLWRGIESGGRTAADTAERQAAENTIVGLQLRTQDQLFLMELWRALRQADDESFKMFESHIPPRLAQAIQASLEAGILQDANVPGPLQRPEYILPEEQQARRERQEAAQLHAKARRAGRIGGEYVVLTLMFASVLFFGGISGTFSHRPVRQGLAGVSLLLFLITISLLLRLPIGGG